MNTHRLALGDSLSQYDVDIAFDRHDEDLEYTVRDPMSWKEMHKSLAIIGMDRIQGKQEKTND